MLDARTINEREIRMTPGVADMTLLKRQVHEGAAVEYTWKVRVLRGKLDDLIAMAQNGLAIALDRNWRRFKFLRQDQTVMPDAGDAVTDADGVTWQLMLADEGRGGYQFTFWAQQNVS